MTPKTKNIIIIVSSLSLVAAAIGTYLYFSKKDDAELTGKGESGIKDIEKQGGGLGNVDESEYSKTNAVPGTKVLKIGEKGRKVAVLQALLNHYKDEKLVIDGDFGDKTRAALYKNGYLTCGTTAQKLALSLVHTICEMPLTDFESLLKKTITDPTFIKLYHPKTNAQMKAVYEKYSS